MNYTTYQHFVKMWERVEAACKDVSPPLRDDMEKQFLAWWNQSVWVALGRNRHDKDVVAGEPIPVYYAGIPYPIQEKLSNA